MLAALLETDPQAVETVVRQNGAWVFLNYSAWLRQPGPEREAVLPVIREIWQQVSPAIPLPISQEEIFSLEEAARALVAEGSALLERVRSGDAQPEPAEVYNLLNRIGDLLRAGGRSQRACIYWHSVTLGKTLDGVSALEDLRATAGLLGQERDAFRTRYSPLELLRQFVETDGPGMIGITNERS